MLAIFNTVFFRDDSRTVVTETEYSMETAYKKDTLATKDDIAKLESKISETKVDLIKWVFTFFAALAIMIIGLYLKK